MLGATSGIARGTGAVARGPAPGQPHTRRCTMATPRSRLSRMVPRAVAALAGSRHPVGGGGGGTLSRHLMTGGPALAGCRPLLYTPAAASRLPRPGGLAHHQQTRHLAVQWSAMAPGGAGAGAPAAPVAGVENNGGGEGGPDGGWGHRPLPDRFEASYLEGMNKAQRAAIVAPIAPLKVTVSSQCTCAPLPLSPALVPSQFAHHSAPVHHCRCRRPACCRAAVRGGA
jgi:hypothetical protein